MHPNDDCYLDWYLTLLERNYAPQQNGELINFTYENMLMNITRISRFGYKIMIPNVTNTEGKNKAYVQKLINETISDCQNRVRITIDYNIVNMIVIGGIDLIEDFKIDLTNYIQILTETYNVFTDKIIKRYGNNNL